VDHVKFYFDPRCPWCYQTSRWANRLEQLGEIELDWGVFSLEVANLPEGEDPRQLEAVSGPALRTAVTIRDRVGSPAIGPFYAALGARIWEQPPPPEDMVVAVRSALEEGQLDPSLVDAALADRSSWDAVLAEHDALVTRTGAFGVPTLVVDGDAGPAMFGPVISTLPNDEDAVELWRHTRWLVRDGNFAELKRGRGNPPDLPTAAWFRREREKASAAAAT
jgi:2-hydroxychromene-2-carboxylate isomerase